MSPSTTRNLLEIMIQLDDLKRVKGILVHNEGKETPIPVMIGGVNICKFTSKNCADIIRYTTLQSTERAIDNLKVKAMELVAAIADELKED